jgi:ADP-heptose:LPS heptosyltransferase
MSMIARMTRRAFSAAVLFTFRALATRKRPTAPGAAIRRAIVFRFGGIGDCIAITALTRTMRRRWPKAHLAVATVEPCKAVFAGNPDIDEIVTGERMGVTAHPRKMIRQLSWMRRHSDRPWDLAVFTHNGFADLAMAFFLRARVKVGFDTDDRGFDFALTHSSPIYTERHPKAASVPRRHAIEHFHDLLRAFLGEDLAVSGAVVALSEAERREASAWLARQGLGRPLLVIAPGGTEAIKMWPVARFAELARRCSAWASVVIIGGVGETLHDARFAGLGQRVRFAAGQLTLRQSFALIAQADALVGSDTGMMHAGAALGIPIVTIFGPTPSWVYGYEGPDRVILKAALDCVPCRSETCRLLPASSRPATPPCLDAIQVETVIEAVSRIMGDVEKAVHPR